MSLLTSSTLIKHIRNRADFQYLVQQFIPSIAIGDLFVSIPFSYHLEHSNKKIILESSKFEHLLRLPASVGKFQFQR